MKVYIKVTNDKYSLIEAIADTARELAKICNTTEASIYSSISHGHKTYERVDIGEK
jgi:hypothetical protein|nr:MAG TPA: hypothetical protein [Caudoviricetes sp.]